MREAIGGTWIMQLVIVFMLLFVAFLALSLNYSKAFQMKNDMLTMIEKKEGVTAGTITLINNYLKNNGYHVTRTCPSGSYGVASLDSTTATQVTGRRGDNNQYLYCITKRKSSKLANDQRKVYYEVDIFFYFNLPVIGDIFKFTIHGNTNDIIPHDRDEITKNITE